MTFTRNCCLIKVGVFFKAKKLSNHSHESWFGYKFSCVTFNSFWNLGVGTFTVVIFTTKWLVVP